MNILSKFLKKKTSSPDHPEIYDDDIFLVSYPKSGNTWVRFLIANLLKKEGEQINFHTAINYVPEINVHNEVLEKLPRPRIIKSHQTFNPAFKKVIYLIRDPKDVYVSFFHYQKKKNPKNTTFSEFLRKVNSSPNSWHKHVASWKDKSNVIALFRYEDLLSNTFTEVERLVKALGIKASEEQLAKAIQESSFTSMKKIEKESGRPFKNESDKANATTFVRSGKKGDWVNYFTEEDINYLSQSVKDLATHFHYKI
ncbi:sulfotransferase domain-containing protein [Porifericola rhodea]|uniref:sulfotransferase domain-containing protein n=1 Tax=Porifericola rhodea TaxID=930972 RepID=UPI0026657083|nr:sulfotransferase domain-containing protein [Porifericola rhodea]WKN33494.1 sulfotransferase domain-containing protein [Porifericola rhodea]